jgi:TolA-binding protein
MSRKLSILVSTAASFAIAMLLVSGDARADTKKKSTLSDEEVCIPKAVEDKVTTCPGGFKMGEFKGSLKAKVGVTKKKKEEKKKPKGPTGPSLGRDYTQAITESAFKRKREKKKIDILKKEIELIKRLAAQTSNDNPEKGEILKRLADAYKEFHDQLNFMARDLDEKIFQAKEAKKKKTAAKLKAQQKALDKKAEEYRELAIKAYVEIRNNFPDYPDYDEILFAIAYEIDQMASALDYKQKDKKASYRERARIFYQELIRNYPRSRFIPHAWMAFGEYYFHEARDVDRAMRAYEKVVEWGEANNPNYVVAMYYQAWCLFNMQEFKKTINQFNKVIQYANDNPEHREAQTVAKRARMELVDSYSKIGNPAQAWEFFQRVGGNQAHDMLIKLANLYYDEGHWADAIIVFHKLEALEIENYKDNNGNELCEYQTMVTNAVISSLGKDKQVQELKRQISLYKRFAGEGNHDPVKVKKCGADTISLSWDQATHWHLEAVGSESSPGTKDPATMNLCIELYDEVLKNFPDLDTLAVEGFDEKTKPSRYRVAYYKAELYWNMENWEKAAAAFDAVVDMDPAGEYTADSAYAAVLCYNKLYTKLRGEKDKERKHKLHTGEKKCDKACKKCKKGCNKKKGDEKKKCVEACVEGDKIALRPRDLTELEAGTLKSYERYVCYVKGSDDLVNIKYRRARIFYEANMFAEAAVLFKDIAVNHSSDEVAVYAANLYLDCLNVLGSMVEKPIPSCYDNLAEIVDVFIDTSKKPGKNLMKDEAFATQIKALKVGVLRKKAESLNKRQRFREAAEIYLIIYREYKGVYDDRGMCEVLFNTAINMEAARLVMSAIKVREKMIELYPKCEHSKKAAYYIGQNYHALQSFQLAADNYRSFAKKYSGEDEAPTALGNAITFYIGLGKIDEALSTIKLFEKNYAKRRTQETATIVFSSGYIYLNDKDYDRVRKHFASYLKRYSKAKQLDEQVQANVFIGDTYRLEPNKRKRDLNKADKYYKKALKIFDADAMKKVEDNKRKAAMLIAAAKARFYIAERKYHAFQRIKFPEFSVERKIPRNIEKWWEKEEPKEKREAAAKWRKDRKRLARWGYYDESKSVKEQLKEVKKEERKEDGEIQFKYWLKEKFAPWMEKKSAVLKEATDMFAGVAELHVPEWEMAAAARAGDMQIEFMNALYDAPIPPSIKGDQELVDIYRGAMDEKAQPFRDGAVGGYAHCLNISTKVRWFNENSLRCERELNKLEPRQYPISEEIRVMPKTELVFWTAPEPVLELETEAQKREKALAASADAIGGKAKGEEGGGE